MYITTQGIRNATYSHYIPFEKRHTKYASKAKTTEWSHGNRVDAYEPVSSFSALLWSTEWRSIEIASGDGVFSRYMYIVSVPSHSLVLVTFPSMSIQNLNMIWYRAWNWCNVPVNHPLPQFLSGISTLWVLSWFYYWLLHLLFSEYSWSVLLSWMSQLDLKFGSDPGCGWGAIL